MDKKQYEKLIHLLDGLGQKFDTLIALQKSVIPKKELSSEETKVLNLCNGKNTIEIIAQRTGKTKDNVRATLSNLRNKGLVKSNRINNKQVYSVV